MIERVITPTMVAAAKASPSRLLAFAEINTSSGWVRVQKLLRGNNRKLTKQCLPFQKALPLLKER